jgi:hypothetical protein
LKPEPGREESGTISDTFERLLSDVEDGFAAIERKTNRPGTRPGVAQMDLTEVRQLFDQLAANHMRQVRDFMIDVRWGQATVDWIATCEPATESLRRAADKLELSSLSSALADFAGTLRSLRDDGVRAIEGVERDTVLARYAALTEIMPQAFALDMDRTQRETLILQSLFAQIPNMTKATMDKLYSAGLTTLESVFLANAADVAATTGISEDLARRIVDRVRAYKEEIRAFAPDPSRARERERLAEFTAELRSQNEDYARVCSAWDQAAEQRKKALRKEREKTAHQVNLVLARLGEVQVLSELERASFEQKLVRLETFLKEAEEKYVV